MKVWYNGNVMDANECRISILDHGLLYGDGVFEGIRITGGRVFRLSDHLARLQRSARALGIELPYTLDETAAIVLQTAAAFGRDEAYIRLLLTRGVGELSLDPLSCEKPQLICIAAEIRMFPAATYSQGIRLMTASSRRPGVDVLDPQVKSLNYLNNVLAKREARLKGFDDALMLNQSGRVAEASGANIFAVIDGVLATPPAYEGALPGVTRATVLEARSHNNLPVSERPLTCYDLLAASEVFLSGSGAGLIPVYTLDDTVIGGGDRPVFEQAVLDYRDFSAAHGTPFAPYRAANLAVG
jgi:branched-chain amino acid aminotransferase